MRLQNIVQIKLSYCNENSRKGIFNGNILNTLTLACIQRFLQFCKKRKFYVKPCFSVTKHSVTKIKKKTKKQKRAKMALDRSPEYLKLPLPFFFVPFREEFTRISLCLYSASSPHSLIPCLLTDQNFTNNF